MLFHHINLASLARLLWLFTVYSLSFLAMPAISGFPPISFLGCFSYVFFFLHLIFFLPLFLYLFLCFCICLFVSFFLSFLFFFSSPQCSVSQFFYLNKLFRLWCSLCLLGFLSVTLTGMLAETYFSLKTKRLNK